jgi:hypothetical protein
MWWMSDTTDYPKSPHQTPKDRAQATQENDNEGTCSQNTLFEYPFFLPLASQSVSYGSPLQDPFIHTSFVQAYNELEEGWQEEDEVISTLGVSPPNRELRQARSSGGKLAYVIFGDQTTGIYYNWYDLSSCWVHIKLKFSRNSCEYKLNSYSHSGSRKPRYYGYATYNEAIAAWAFYLENRVVPFPPLDGGISATPVPSAPLAQPMTPQRNRQPNVQFNALGSSPTPGSPSRASFASPPARSTIISSPPPLSSQLSSLSPRHTLPIQQTTFFIVMVGYNPGVFASQ